MTDYDAPDIQQFSIFHERTGNTMYETFFLEDFLEGVIFFFITRHSPCKLNYLLYQ